eukprot:49009-Rhodomonas_salina.1
MSGLLRLEEAAPARARRLPRPAAPSQSRSDWHCTPPATSRLGPGHPTSADPTRTSRAARSRSQPPASAPRPSASPCAVPSCTPSTVLR